MMEEPLSPPDTGIDPLADLVEEALRQRADNEWGEQIPIFDEWFFDIQGTDLGRDWRYSCARYSVANMIEEERYESLSDEMLKSWIEYRMSTFTAQDKREARDGLDT